MANIFKILFERKNALDEKDYKRSEELLIADGIFAMGMGALCGGPFLPAFALALGASNYEIGALTTIALLSQLVQLPALLLLKWIPYRKAIAVIFATLSRLCWLPIALAPFLFKEKNGMFFVTQWFLVSAILGAVCGPPWNSLLKDIMPQNQIGRIFARRMVFGSIFMLILTLAGGYFSDTWKAIHSNSWLYSYSFLFLIGLAFGLIASAAIAYIPEPKAVIATDTGFFSSLFIPIKDKNFRKLLIFSAIWNVAMNISGPFFIIYMMDYLKISLSMVTLLTVTGQLSNIFFLRMWGTFTDKYKCKPVLAVSGTLYLLSILAWSFTTMPDTYFLTLPILFLINIAGGCASAGINLSYTGIALKLSPNEKSAIYMTTLGLISAAAGAFAPLLGGVLADFFSSREFALSITWKDASHNFSMSAVHFKALDFVFAFSFVVGIAAMNYLRSINEEGEFPSRDVIHDLIDHVAVPIRQLTTIDGIKHLVLDNVIKILRVTGQHLHILGNHDNHLPE